MALGESWHPLRGEWGGGAAHRQNRPWSGGTIEREEEVLPEYLPDCYLCPDNKRVSGNVNPQYTQTFVFDNDHPSVALDAPADLPQPTGIYRNRPARGIARVVCYSPKHNLTLGELEPEGIEQLLRVWQEQYVDLGSRPEIAHVLIFENKGEAVGVSNPHPHCQIYANNFIFKTIETEARASQRHLSETGRVLFQDIIAAERRDEIRIIAENDTAIAFLPYFARYAYEVFVAPKQTHPSIATFTDTEVRDFADVLKRVLVKCDNHWQLPCPYVIPLHQAPPDGGDYSGFHFHIEFHPPLRKPNLLKYLAGPEIGGGNFLSDTLAEEKAAAAPPPPDVHYKHKSGQEMK